MPVIKDIQSLIGLQRCFASNGYRYCNFTLHKTYAICGYNGGWIKFPIGWKKKRAMEKKEETGTIKKEDPRVN